MAPDDYLKRPYGRVVVPEADGSFRAEIIEFPGCIAVGDAAAEALANLEEVAASWLEATIAKGQRVPEPTETVGFSGKLVLRLQKSLHKKAAHLAAREGVSLNQFIVNAVAEQIGSVQAHSTTNLYVQVGLFPAPAAAVFGNAGQTLSASTSSGQMAGISMTIQPHQELAYARG
jgi:predicted RNase H-like HicB family nuclease